MNIFEKTYCRVFQFAFKMAIPVLPYRNPHILNSTTEISNYIKEKNIRKVLIVTDKSINQLGLMEPMKKALEQQEIQYVIFDETVPNPTVQNVEDAKQIYIDNNCNALIGFGGGSAMDCAKMVGARIARPKKPISKMEGILTVLKKTPLFIGVPTTAGTGSETTVTAVITDEKSGHKFPVSDFCLIPDVADESTDAEKATKELIAKIRGMNENMGIPTKLSGIEKKDISALAKYAEKEANPLYPVPKLMTAKELESFYYAVGE